jgi:hypothetical protein
VPCLPMAARISYGNSLDVPRLRRRRLQAGTSVYTLTLAFVTSILPSRFDEILSIVDAYGVPSMHHTRLLHAHALLWVDCMCENGTAGEAARCFELWSPRKLEYMPADCAGSLLAPCAGMYPWTWYFLYYCTTQHGSRGGRRTLLAASLHWPPG